MERKIIKDELKKLQELFEVVNNNYACALSDCREAISQSMDLTGQVSDLIKYIEGNLR